MIAYNIPWSSLGMNPEGKLLLTPIIPSAKRKNKSTVKSLRWATRRKTPTYRSVNFSNLRLNQSMNRLIQVLRRGFPWVSFRIMAHNTGVTVKATIPDNTMDEAMVMENCR